MRKRIPPPDISELPKHNGLPLFAITKTEQNPDAAEAVIVSFRCPYCKCLHSHGVLKTDDPAKPRHRVAHCFKSTSPLIAKGYYFVRVPPKTAAVA